MKNKTSSKKVPTPFSLRQIAHRLYPLGPILVLVALTACCSIEPGTRIVCNTLAPDCTYDLYVGYPSARIPREPHPPAIVEAAAKFTAMSDGNLATVLSWIDEKHSRLRWTRERLSLRRCCWVAGHCNSNVTWHCCSHRGLRYN
jgi:hypothetical protein